MPQTDRNPLIFNKEFARHRKGIFLDTLPLYLWRVDNQPVLWT